MSKFEHKISAVSARCISQDIWKAMLPEKLAKEIHICGSWIRGKTLIGDLDVMIELNACEYKALIRVAEDSGKFKCIRGGQSHITLVTTTRKIQTQVDVYFYKEEYKAPMSLFLTGSGRHNMKLRSIAKNKLGLKLNQYGLFYNNKRIDANSEYNIYNILGKRYIDPCDRIDGTELDLPSNQLRKTPEDVYTCISTDGSRKYTIKNGRCNCLGYKYRQKCKHTKEYA